MVATWADGLYTGFGSSGVPSGGCSPARQASMPDSPPQAIHGLLSASPARDAASTIRCRGFFDWQPKRRCPSQGEPCPGGRGSRQARHGWRAPERSEEHTSELQSLMRISYAVFCLKKKKKTKQTLITIHSEITKNHI